MKKNNRRIIKLFESVPTFDTYSQYSVSLEKVFHENSLKNLIKNLRTEKKAKIFSYFDQDEQKVESNKYNIFKRRKNIKKDDSKNNLLYDEEVININNKEKESQNPTINPESNRFFDRRTINYNNPESDPFRYNPNYNSIMKKVPCVKIIKPPKINIKRPSTFLTEVGDLAVGLNNLKKSYLDNKNKNKKLPNIQLMKEIYNRKKRLSLLLNKDKDNHSIRFDKYSDRKETILKTNPNVSYIEPFDYQKVRNNSTDFNKMTSRDKFDILNIKKSEGPSIGYYNPHYEYFEDRVRNISLGNEHIDKKNKKMLLKKLWGSYKVKLDYELIDNSKLNTDMLKNNKNDYEPIVNYTESNKGL
jgi:hypothetical protein